MMSRVCFLVALGALCAHTGTAQAETVEITAYRLNVRSGPGTRYRVLKVAKRGERYGVIQRRGNWAQLRLGGGVGGWSYGRYLRAVSAPQPPTSTGRVFVVTARSLNVRSGPSTRYRILGRLSNGSRVTVRASRGAWREIDFRGRRAWVHGSYLRTPGTTPPPTTGRRRSRAGFIQLRSSGPGFYSYQRGDRRWGRPDLIYGIERAARKWSQRRTPAGATLPRIGVGDISRENGGYFPPHVSHRYGVDADLRPMRSDREGPVTIDSRLYSRSRTQAVISLLVAEVRLDKILFNDRGVQPTRYYKGHGNHFHLRIRR